jgi:type II secretory pathway pseudopilin PulG
MPTGKAPRQPPPRVRGFTLIAVLAAMFLLALATQQVMNVVSQQAQREREAELLRIGAAYVRAIGVYYETSPGTVKRWPRALEELTDDKRFVNIRRYLREAYADPVTRSRDWGLIQAPDGGIAGVFSLSDAQPIRSGAMDLGVVVLPAASRYADWQFEYVPRSGAVGGKP